MAAVVAQRSALHEHRTGAATRRRDRAAAGVWRSAPPTTTAGKPVSSICRAIASSNVRHGRGAMYRTACRGTVLDRGRRAALAAGSVPHGRGRGSRRAAAARTARRHRAIRELKAPPARSTSSTCSCAHDLVRGNPLVRRGFQARFTHIFVDEFQDTDPLQAEICCCSRPTTPPRPTGAGPAGPRPAVSRRRSETVDLPLPPGRCRHLSRGVAAARRTGSATAAAEHQLRSVPEIQACVNRVRAGHDRR